MQKEEEKLVAQQEILKQELNRSEAYEANLLNELEAKREKLREL